VCRIGLIAVGCATYGIVGTSAAQTPSSGQVVLEAQRLRNGGDFAAAAKLLRAELDRRPNDGEVARLLAETLYWLHDPRGAQALYETIVQRHPQDTTSRLAYARMLSEIGELRRAQTVATPLLQVPATRVEANVLVGTVAYWRGDLTSAQRHFQTALQLNPSQSEARRQLDEIRSVTASWLRVSASSEQDDQPVEFRHAAIEGGWFLNPLSPLTLRFETRRYDLSDGARQTVWDGEAALAHYAPALRLDTEIRGGVHRRLSFGNSVDWKGAVAAGFRLPGHLSVRAMFERAPYLHTVASLETPIFSRTLSGIGRWQDPRGWLGEWGYQQQRYPDGNTVRSVYGWQLVPFVFRKTAELRAGYAFSRDHADESRFVLAMTSQPYPPSDPAFDLSGRYDPYYTPSHVKKHSVIVATMFQPSRGATVRVAGTYAFRATEDAPLLYVGTGAIERTFYERSFFPRSTRGSLDLSVSRRVIISASAEAGRTAFYTWKRAGLQLTYRLAPTPQR
jgi:tetratricopeptide (TPR) repeat protein